MPYYSYVKHIALPGCTSERFCGKHYQKLVYFTIPFGDFVERVGSENLAKSDIEELFRLRAFQRVRPKLCAVCVKQAKKCVKRNGKMNHQQQLRADFELLRSL